MTTLSQIRVAWSGAPVVGGGVSTFYAVGDPLPVVTALNTFFGAIKAIFPAGTSIRVAQEGNELDSNNGDVTGGWSGGVSSPQLSATAGSYAGGVGVRVNWQTAGITNGRHVHGSTFLVPLVTTYYSADGSIDDTLIGGTLQNAINSLLSTTAGALVIWTRPRATTSGVEHAITGGSAVDKVSWLRSRRT